MKRKLTYEGVYEEIKRKIKEGSWKPGDQIPTVQKLSVEMGVGVSSVREAIRILSKQKILNVKQGCGTFVTKFMLSDSLPVRLDFLENATMLQLTEARLILEPELAALATENATEMEVRAISKVADAMKESVQKNQDFFAPDMEFHHLIAKSTKNEILYYMFNMITDLLIDSRRRTMKVKEMNEKASHYHVLIAMAIAHRNPSQARVLMRSHIEDVLIELKKNEPFTS